MCSTLTPTAVRCVPWTARRFCHPLGQPRPGCHRLDHRLARLHPARRLTAETMELAVAGQNAQRPGRYGGGDTQQKIMRVGRKDDTRRIGQAQLCGDMGLRGGPQLVHHPPPFAIGEAGGVLPAGNLAHVRRIRPQMMAMRRKMQPVRRGGQAALEQIPVIPRAHSIVLKDHSSGKARFASVDCR